MVDVVSREFIERNDIAWKVIPNSKDVIIFCGDEHAMHTSGYVDATLRFEGSDGLYGLTLYIVDGLPLGINMVLSHNFLIETGTVEFKRPGARTKAMGGFLVAILVAVNKPSLIERLKRHFDRRHPCPPDENQAG
jgi:hypothetical protein